MASHLNHSTIVVSIIVPMYNAERTIGLTIKSVLAQSFENWELLLMDDGSTDRTLEVAGSFSDTRIKIFSDGFNKGIAERLNEAILQSKGSFIARLDADDAMFPIRLQMQIDYFELHPETDVLGTWAVAFDHQNKLTGKINLPLPTSYFKMVADGSCFIHPSIMVRSQWYLSHLYNTTIRRPEDYELWVRTFPFSRFALLEECLLFYRNSGVIEKWKYEEAFSQVKAILNAHKRQLPFGSKMVALAKARLRIHLYAVLVRLGLLNKLAPLSIQEVKEYHTILNSMIEQVER